MRVLIVEDDEATLYMLRDQVGITVPECEIITCLNGQEGLASVQQQSPDLVLSDWNMPVMGGLEFLTKAIAWGLSPDSIIVLTGQGVSATEADSNLAQARVLGITRVLHKPHKLSRLQELILTALGELVG
jgi:two-component system chemotaxis response regulator CheY